MGDCERVGSKVVDHAKLPEADVPAERLEGERPGMVCERDLVASYGRGNRQYSLSRPCSWRLLSQICIDRMGDGGIIVQRVDPGRGHAAVRLVSAKRALVAP